MKKCVVLQVNDAAVSLRLVIYVVFKVPLLYTDYFFFFDCLLELKALLHLIIFIYTKTKTTTLDGNRASKISY
jgi:hypothetical protein